LSNKLKEYKKWEFLKKWNTFEDEKKDELYDEFYSHEINLFLFFKDPDYFKEVVRPFIVNKCKKSFMDHFLLNPSPNLV